MTDGLSIASEEAWGELRDELFRYIRRQVADEHVAEDLLQETFARVLNGVDALESRDRLAPWVFRAARNAVVDHYRSRGASGVADALSESELPAASPVGNRNAEVSSWMPGLVAMLPDDARRAVQLAELDGLPMKDVAEHLGVSVSAAKSRVQRGRARMREMLTTCCRFELDRRGNVLDWQRRGEACACDDGVEPRDRSAQDPRRGS